MNNLAQLLQTEDVLDFNIDTEYLSSINQKLELMTVHQRVEWAMLNLPSNHMVSSSFGAQSAVMLHLLNDVAPGIPVVLTDTGYLFPETYQFIDDMSKHLDLNLHVYTAKLSSGWQEARHGKLWDQGVEGIELYNNLNKVEPMQRAIKALGVKTWFAGLRRQQSASRGQLKVLQKQSQQFKFHPIIDQSNKQLHEYLKAHQLPYNPLWEKGYVSIGDWHTTIALQEGMTEEDTRFFGLKRECGLHEFGDGDGI
ncbi:MAG: phosphoadenosine phosphosulfate reductase [Granulosicoccus sp.]|jgi:phosphoadenosine phosphosulfate reductase